MAVNEIETFCDIDWLDTTANVSFSPRGTEHQLRIAGLREITFDQGDDTAWLVMVRDAGDPADGDEGRSEKTHSILVKDPTGIAVLNAIVELLASPASYPPHQDILGPDDEETGETRK